MMRMNMFKPPLSLFPLFFSLLLMGCGNDNSKKEGSGVKENTDFLAYYNLFEAGQDSLKTGKDSLKNNENPKINITKFAGPDLVPSPSTLAVAADGDVFVGVDMAGSLGKDPGKGMIMKLVDSDNDGEVDEHSVFVQVNNPRGIIPMGDKLYVMHSVFSEETDKAIGMSLVVFEDKNDDGVADGPSKPLIEHISNAKFIAKRGVDHATNGIRMGIDGWIYIAVGDFGFYNAVDRTGKKLTMLGGGVVRVRPDGTEMEIYAHGTRNIYDMAIDPFMNIFTRGNTNDGGGWNIRFLHIMQTAEYGYPTLFKHFTDEIIPALVDLGGGSGTGAFFMANDAWPDKYNHVPMMADWGRSQLYIHRVTPVGAGFTQEVEEFIALSQITDLDIDASGRMYLSAWDGAGYSGNPGKGFVVRAVPEGWEHQPFPNLKESSIEELTSLLKSGSGGARLHAQRELLNRPKEKVSDVVWKIASNKELPLAVQVAGIYTYSQIAAEGWIDNLVKLTENPMVREFALRALSDRKTRIDNVPIEPFLEGLKDPMERVQAAAIIALGRLGKKEAAEHLLDIKVPESLKPPVKDSIGPHATPNAEIIPAHLAVKALVALNAVDAVVAAIGTENSRLALWTLRYMYEPEAVNGLIAAYEKTEDKDLKKQILTTLSRLYKEEAPYDGSWWWNTRPDTHGPIYKGIVWKSSPKIKQVLMDAWEAADASEKQFFIDLNNRHRMDIKAFAGEVVEIEEEKEIEIDLEKIKSTKGQVGKASIENVLLAMQEIEGDASKGEAIFESQGCIACHSVSPDAVMKGPFMGQIGSIMSREQIAESILKPNASISQGFSTYLITTKDGKTYQGFISKATPEITEMRNIVGKIFTLKTEDIKTRKILEKSMMPAGLVNALSYEEFASLLTYLSQQKK